MLQPDMPSINDREGTKVPVGLPPVIDTHVHIFPRNIAAAIHKWFDTNAWPIRYRLTTSRIFDFLLSRGIRHIIALQYAHKPGIAGMLNQYMAEKCQEYQPWVSGMATVFPGEDNAGGILQQAFDLGLNGLKLHAHVQCFDMNAKYMDQLYECCRKNGKPIIMHVGREPKSAAYNCDPYLLCSAAKCARVVQDFPELKICVPHLGFDETAAYRELIEKYDNIWLDTTMIITDYFPMRTRNDLRDYRPDRIMYGSDFPNIPYAWDRELKVLQATDIDNSLLQNITFGNAIEFFNLKDFSDESADAGADFKKPLQFM